MWELEEIPDSTSRITGAQDVEMSDKDFKITMLSMFKELKENTENFHKEMETEKQLSRTKKYSTQN